MLMLYIKLLLLGPAVIVTVFVIKTLLTTYRVHSLISYCGIDMIDALKAEPAKMGRMIFDKLTEKGNLLVYKNDNLKKRMKIVGINEEADDYGYDIVKVTLWIKESPEAKLVSMLNMEIIDFYFADLSKKNYQIKQLYEDLQRIKKEVDYYAKMTKRYAKL